jgi:putative two-component system response regulator
MMKKILFVDDEPNVFEAFERMLRPERFVWDLHSASGVAEALAKMEEHEYDTIVSDYNMPGQNGFALLEAVRRSEASADIPFVIVTGSSDSSLKRIALELGATDLLSKPVQREDLVARLRNVLRLKEYQDAILGQNQSLEQLVDERTSQLAASKHETIWRLAKAAESRDEDTGNHVVRVGCYCRMISETLGMSDEFVQLIFLASPLHDIGKIGIPDRVLLKPAKLDPAEWEIMKTHAKLGAEILSRDLEIILGINAWAPASLANTPMVCDNPILEMAAVIALSHHEKWDGSGYPNGISGEDIPIAARIVAVADVYDALCSERPYKRAMPEEQALQIMEEGRGKHFDPTVLDAFLESLPRLREVRLQFAESFPRAEVA